MIAFSGNPLDRASEKRSDAALLSAMRADARARVLPLWKLQPLLLGLEDAGLATGLGFIDGALASGLGAPGAVEVFLGLDGDTPVFARDISALPDPLAGALAGHGHFRDARSAASLLALKEIAILGQAKALIDWHARHGFCAQCGAATGIADGGYRRICPDCKAEHFPRTDPAVIMLVTSGIVVCWRATSGSPAAITRLWRASSSRARPSRRRCAARSMKRCGCASARCAISRASLGRFLPT